MLVKGKVVDGNNQPITNINVSAKAYIYDLGNDVTDSQGRFDFASLASNAETFEIHINKTPNEFSDANNSGYNPQLSSVSYIYYESAFQETYALIDTKLQKTATLDFKIEKMATSSDTLFWQLNYKSPTCTHYIGGIPSGIGEDQCYVNDSTIERLKPNEPDYENQFHSILNSQAVFTYHINSEEDQNVTIPLNQPSNTYVFNY